MLRQMMILERIFFVCSDLYLSNPTAQDRKDGHLAVNRQNQHACHVSINLRNPQFDIAK